jgi:hypothetical protein
MLSPLEEAPMKATLAPSIPALSFEAETLSSGISVACRNTVAPVSFLCRRCLYLSVTRGRY